MTKAEPQALHRALPRWLRALISSFAPWISVILVAVWLRWPSPWLLLASAALALSWIVGPLPRSRLQAWGVFVLVLIVPTGFAAHRDLLRYTTGWHAYWSERESDVERRLGEELTALIDAAQRAADLAAEAADSLQGSALDRTVQAIHDRTGMAGLAVYGPDERLVTWHGRHQGEVPPVVRSGRGRFAFGASPLFSYAYITAPVPRTGGTAVAAALLRAELPPAVGGEADDFASRFRRTTGERISIVPPDREVREELAFDYALGDRSLFAVVVERPAQAERLGEARLRWSRRMGVMLAVAWLLLAAGGYGRRLQLPLAGITLLGMAVLVPFDVLIRGLHPFPAAQILVPGFGGVGLTRLLAVALAGAFAAGLILPRRGRWHPLVSTAVAALAFPLFSGALLWGTPGGVVAGPESDFVLVQVMVAVVLTLVAYVSLRSARLRRGRVLAGAALLAGLLLPFLLVVYAAAWTTRIGPFPATGSALWAVPLGLMAYGLDRGKQGWRGLPRWAMAVLVGSSAALAVAWSARVGARMDEGEARLAALESRVDPYLDFLLQRFGESVDSLDALGAHEVEVLYRGWVRSGLAERSYPLWLTVWSPGNIPGQQFRIGVREDRPTLAVDLLESAREADSVAVHSFGRADANYVALVPLDDGSVVSAVVPARPDVRITSPLSALFATARTPQEDPLLLVPLLPGDPRPADGPPRWRPTVEGWIAEAFLPSPQQDYHAHYTIRIPGPLILTARGTLLFVLSVAAFLAAWGAGRMLARGFRRPFQGWWLAASSFRARVTVALFGFFLLSNAIFGTLAFRALSTATVRATETLAHRITDDAAGWYYEGGGAMELLARRVGGDLLEYRDGELRDGSVEELVALGIYDGWVPLDVQQLLSRGEALRTTRLSSLGGLSYATSFRRLPDGDVLAAPVSLQSGATAVRRREVLDLLGFGAIVGAALSLVLALLVGRALTRPLLTLQVASERVGGGNLSVRLPEERADEFGSVFVAFNRMVGRLRRARRDLVRTTRRTEAIVEEAATGVIALDAAGRVTLVNPRAEELLGREIAVGKPLEEAGGPADELVRWVARYYRDGIREGGTELQSGDRRIRLRARRIERRGPLGGAVLSLEDVTDELRTERILAWGEMAQQVAHEVKNPLTPIKLSVQHIQRAFDDRRPDFSQILSRNVEAILAEIERLASIARSFSSFGAPRAAGEDPLEDVELDRLVTETMALYDTGQGRVTFEGAVSHDLPLVTAREAELKEVLVNLLENARAAVSDAGSVRVEASREPRGVELRVVDDGSGIPPELMPRIFEPHFSTRSTGTGLGLAIVRRLVESWGGSVDIESREGHGTIVRVLLVPWPGERPGTT